MKEVPREVDGPGLSRGPFGKGGSFGEEKSGDGNVVP